MNIEYWKKFKGEHWKNKIDVADFIEKNYQEYLGDDSFLAKISDKTQKVWDITSHLINEEIKSKMVKVEMNEVAGIDNFLPGYIDQNNEVIVGLQTDEPLKRIIHPYGGVRAVENALGAYGLKLNQEIKNVFEKHRKDHNQGVFDVYTDEMKIARSNGLLTGLPDAYGRGRIIGDYRRVALYGIDFLIEEKEKDLQVYIEDLRGFNIQLRENIAEQIRALRAMKKMAQSYGYDISEPATNATEAVQWLYFAYLAGVKENNGAAMSLGRVSTFLDIYIERDLSEGILTEETAQELIDQFVIKLRLVRHLRTPEYDKLFAGDPTWVTEAIGGMSSDNKSLVTKSSYRFIHTLENLDPSPEPNITILWSEHLPENFKRYCALMSIKTAALQYENDDLMRNIYGSDYAIACCVSAMTLGKQMQYFGARCNLAKALLYSLNGGYDELSGDKVMDNLEINQSEILEYDKVIADFNVVINRLTKLYANTMNVIHYMHDKYAYESALMALHNSHVERLMAFGVAGLSVVVDSLSAIKYAEVKPIRNQEGKIIDFEINGDYPKYGNDDDRADEIAVKVLKVFSEELKKHPLHLDAKHTLSVLTITSNVVYGDATGNTPDGRKAGTPFAPGANPMHCRDNCGALASLNTVAKLPYESICEDGISNTFTINNSALGKDIDHQVTNLVSLLNGYFKQGAHHLNVNVLNKEALIDAMNNPEKYPSLTIRVSGYAVNFNRLTKNLQEEVISRTFHESI